jgi:hypothetical protein
VIHAGLHYPPGPLKALCCVEGRDLLYERCARLGIPYRRIGKLVVATEDAEVARLADIRDVAVANGAGSSTPALVASIAQSSTIASASISTSISGEINRTTCTMLVAGRTSPKNSPWARPIASQSRSMSTT